MATRTSWPPPPRLAAPPRPGSSPSPILTSLDRADLDAALLRAGTCPTSCWNAPAAPSPPAPTAWSPRHRRPPASAPFPRPGAAIVTPGIRPPVPPPATRSASPRRRGARRRCRPPRRRPPDLRRPRPARRRPRHPRRDGPRRGRSLRGRIEPRFCQRLPGFVVAGSWLESGWNVACHFLIGA